MQLTLPGTEPQILAARADALWQLRLTCGTARWQVFRDAVDQLLRLGYLYIDPWRIRQPGGEPDANTWGHEEDETLWTTPDSYIPSRTGHQGAEPVEYSPTALGAVQRQAQR